MAARLTLGPNLFNWVPDRWRDAYFRIADEAPLDVVYLGEVVCAKRWPFFAPHLPEVIARLEAAGKEVVLSTLALVMGERDLALVRELCAQDERRVEANDVAAIGLLGGRPHVVGPYVNVYNEGTLAYLAAKGARRLVVAPEVPARTLGVLAAAGLAEIEVQVFGRWPLALSARCYHARSRGLAKDGCRYVCGEDADGMEVFTLEGEPFLAVNGTQTLSHASANLAGEIGALAAMGVSHLRLSPQAVDMVAVARLFRDLSDGRTEAPEAMARLAELAPELPFANGFFFGREGRALAEGPVPV